MPFVFICTLFGKVAKEAIETVDMYISAFGTNQITESELMSLLYEQIARGVSSRSLVVD